jgi:processive 1,2-diacylglycerol beta-glucosyltransferase
MPKQKRFLILSASTGAGHVRAGEAIELWGKRIAPDAVIEHIDIASLLSRPTRKLLVDSYNAIAARSPSLWGAFYHATNAEMAARTAGIFPKILHRLDESPVERAVAEFQPDQIIATHFFPGLFLKRTAPIATVVTDYRLHEFWLSGNPEHFFVGTPHMQNALFERGIDTSRVTVAPIPIHPSFSEKKSIDALKITHGIPKNAKVILVLSGGYGLIRTDRIVETLLQSREPLAIIAIAGKNTGLKNRLNLLLPPPHISLSIVGWTDALDEYMRMADIIIGKPGGLTTTEAIALGKPFIAVDPIPGHEDANVALIETHGYGVLARDISHLLSLIQKSPNDIAPGYKNSPPDWADGGKTIWGTILRIG